MSATQATTRILIVDDDEDDFVITSDYIRHIPGSNYVIDWCYKYNEALKHMLAHNYDLYFVDYRMGAKTGVDLLKEALSNNCHEPIILLTGKGNYKVDIEAMQLGAVDYLIKTDLSTEKMERSIRYALDRAATMKALRDNEKKYRSIFEKSKDLVFLADEELNFRDVNEASTALLEYDRQDLLGMNLADLIDQAQHKKYLQQSLLNKNEIDDWEVVLTTKNGEKKTCVLSATHVKDSFDSSFVQGIIHDISNLKRAEKVTLQAEKMAATGRLVRTLAHEVRNPLNNITLSVEQMAQDVKDDQMALYMNIIERNSKRISMLISELLNTSYPSEIKLVEQHLQGILDDVIGAAIDRLTLKHIKLEVNYPDVPVSVFADREKLKIALLNIVINAIEAMEENTGSLSISMIQQAHNAVLTIRDNGCGISEENVSRLFEPYFTQKRNGMGLGLAFTLNILQAHKAEIEVNSAPGAGTAFVITFPSSGTFVKSSGAEIELEAED